MKKTLLLLSLTTLAALFSSCNMKNCYCCEINGSTVTETESYTESTSPCSSLNNKTRTCLESGERIPGCEGVAIGFKK